MSSDVNDRDDERTDPHIAAPKSSPATPPALPRASGVPQRPMPGAVATTGTMPKVPMRTLEPGPRVSEAPRPPILPTASARPSAPTAPPAASPSIPPERMSEAPPPSGLMATMLIPRPSTVAPPGRASDPGGDPLRERLAQVEVQSAATRSIASRVESEAGRAHARLDALEPRVGGVESAWRERAGQLAEAIESNRRAIEARIDDLGARPTAPMLVDEPDVTGLKTAVATMRHTIAEHERQFEARRARVESLETRITTLEADPRLVELRRTVEGFDLRIVAIERAQAALAADVDTRLKAIEARLAEAPVTPAKKAAAPEPELRRIKGVGPKYEKALRDVGITTLAQVAAMSDDDLARIASALGVPVERVRKLGWPETARALLAG